MNKVFLKRIISTIVACLLLFTQTIAYAVDVVIEDPTPDLTAPILNSISASSNELSPTTPVVVQADISDELSGFSDGYITYKKPNNQTVNASFAFNATTNKFEATIRVSSTDIPGVWKASTVFLKDKKDNSVNLTHLATQSNGEKIDFSNLDLNVVGVSPPPEPTDKEAPKLHSININSQQVTVNEKIEISAEATDNESGISTAYATYRMPNGQTKNIYLSKNQAGQFIGTYTIGKYDKSGEWKLISVYLNDKVGNSKTYTSYFDNNNNQITFENCTVTVSGTTVDEEAPVLHDISVASKLVRANEKIEVRAEITDNESGVDYVQVSYKKPSGVTGFINLYKNTTTGQFVGSVVVGQYEERGNRVFTSVFLRDKVGNSQSITKYIDADNNEKDFSHCTVDVVGTTPDWEGPEFTGGSISTQQISPTQVSVKLVIDVEDQLSGIANSLLSGTYKKPSGRLLNLSFLKNNGQYTATILIDKYDELGLWTLESLSIRDAVGNYTRPTKIGVSPLSEFDINVMGKITITPGTPNNILLEAPSELNGGQSYQLKPILRYSNPSEEDKDITNDPATKYTSSDTSLLTVNTQGLMTVPSGAGPGFVTVEVTYGDVRKEMLIEINGGKVESYLQVSPLLMQLHSGQTGQMKVVEVNDGARKDVTQSTSGIIYSSSNPSLVTVTKDGYIQVVSEDLQGTAYINVAYNGLKGTTIVRVSKPTVKSLSISPKEETLSLNNKLQLVLKAFMSDGTTKDVSSGLTGTIYTSSDTKRAIVDQNGLINIPPNAVSGSAVIKAKYNNLIVQSTITVNGLPELTSIQVTPDDFTMNPGDDKNLQVIAHYSNETTKDITASTEGTTYTSSNPERVTVDTEGKITIPDNATFGTAVITVKNEAFQITLIVTVEKDSSKDIKSLTVTPDTPMLKTGDTQQLTVTAIMGNGDTKDLTASSEGTTYTSSNTSRAIVDAEGKITVPSNAPLGIATITVKNGTFQTQVTITVVKNPANDIQSLNVTPETLTLKTGETQQLTVTATVGDGSTKDITASSEGTAYSSSNTLRATIDAEGKIHVPNNAPLGIATITVKNGIFQKQVTVTVVKNPANEVKSLVVTPGTVTLKTGEIQQLAVVGTLGDGSTKDITPSIEGTVYTSSNTLRATVDAEGKITVPGNASLGTVTITVKNGIAQGQVIVTVVKNPATEVKSFVINPGAVTLKTGEIQQLTVTATLGDGSTKDITASSEGTVYTSSNALRASVDAEGKISALSNATLGTVTITVKNGTIQSTIIVTVVKNPATEIKSLVVTPATVTLKTGDTQQITATATMGDGSTKNISASSEGTVYASSNTTRATVDANGNISVPNNATLGTVTITVKNGTFQGTVNITVVKNPATEIKSIVVTPSSPTLKTGETQQITVTATMGDGSTKNISASSEGTVYTNSNTTRAIVDTNGKITIPNNASLGTVIITAKNGTFQGTVFITVVKNPATEITSLVVSPQTATLKTGETQQVTATATMADGSTKNVSAGSEGTVYTSSNTSRATVDVDGKITIPTNASLGTVTITVKNGTFQGQVTLTVVKNPATEITSLAVTPSSGTLKTGETQQLTVTATMADGSTKDITASSGGTIYTSSAPSRAAVDSEGNINIPLSATAGSVTITVKNGTFQTSITFNIVKDPSKDISNLVVTPGAVTLKVGDTQQITAIATMGDGSAKDITASINGTEYTSSNPLRAVVDSEGKITIPSGSTPGTATITVKNGTINRTVVITVG